MAETPTSTTPAVTLESIIKRMAHNYVNGPNCGWYDERKGKPCGEPPDGKHHIRYGPHREISWMHEFEPEQVHDPNCACKALESYAAEQRAFREGLEKLRDAMRKKYEHASDYSAAGLLRWYADELTALLDTWK